MQIRRTHLLSFLLLNFYFLLFLSSCSVSKQISKKASSILLNDTAISKGHIGISIYEPATNTYWYNYNATKYFVPASNTKLFTLYAGMKYLGDSLVGARISVDEKNRLLVFPSGDPTFLNSEFSNQPLFEKMKRYKEIYLYNDHWKDERWGNGWAWNDYDAAYMAERSIFPIYGNIVNFYLLNDTLKIFPKKVSVGTTTILGYNGQSGIIQSKKFTISRRLDDNDFFLSLSNIPFTNTSIPLRTDIGLISEILEDTLKAEVVPSAIAAGYNFNPKKIIIHSQPSDSLFKPMMHRSDNFFAEQTLLMASNEHLGYMSDEKIIDTLLKSDLKDVPQKPRWVDGSGLSRYNLFTPQSFVYILNKMKNEFGWDRIKNILPTGGTGTLSSYFKKDSGFIYAKTGTLSNNCALSGYLITQKGKVLIFSVLVNNYQTGATPVRKAVEKFLQSIREKY
jgi:D-alanyl-D-alanine carboxypeptidase/D-alanyl-D-alanine-endopeptidase (penicillin-binding protein 4)